MAAHSTVEDVFPVTAWNSFAYKPQLQRLHAREPLVAVQVGD